MGRMKKRGIEHFGIDYFRAVVSALKSSVLFTLGEGSNFIAYDKETTIELLSGISDKWERYYRIYDNSTGIAIAFVGIGGKSDDRYAPARDFFEVSGQGLILRNWPRWFIDCTSQLHLVIEKFTRIDVCLDLINVSVPYIYDRILSVTDKKTVSKIFFDKQKGKPQTVYFGEKSREKNTYQLIRIYDKQADNASEKHKEFLYPWYEKYENVTRFEIELREDLAKFWTVDKLLSDNYIFAVMIKKFYRYNYQFFGFLKFDDFVKKRKQEDSLYRERIEKIRARKEHMDTYGSSFKSPEEKTLWLATFATYGKRLVGDGMTGEEILGILWISVVPSPIGEGVSIISDEMA